MGPSRSIGGSRIRSVSTPIKPWDVALFLKVFVREKQPSQRSFFFFNQANNVFPVISVCARNNTAGKTKKEKKKEINDLMWTKSNSSGNMFFLWTEDMFSSEGSEEKINLNNSQSGEERRTKEMERKKRREMWRKENKEWKELGQDAKHMWWITFKYQLLLRLLFWQKPKSKTCAPFDFTSSSELLIYCLCRLILCLPSLKILHRFPAFSLSHSNTRSRPALCPPVVRFVSSIHLLRSLQAGSRHRAGQLTFRQLFVDVFIILGMGSSL